MILREKELFQPLKKYFNEQGYKVFPEVPCMYRCVDFVAVKPDDHIAVEMKTSFSHDVVRQAHTNALSFHRSYVAFPVKRAINFESNDVYWKLRPSIQERIEHCRNRGIGIIQIIAPHNIIFTVLEAKEQKPYKVFDFDGFEESDTDEAGLPFQKGRSSAFTVLDQIKRYVERNPNCDWDDIYKNVQNHYSSKQSLRQSMGSWKGFNLDRYKRSLGID